MDKLTGPSVLAMLSKQGEFDGCHAWRIWQPFAALERRLYPAWWDWNGDTGVALPNPQLRGHSILDLTECVILPRMTWRRQFWPNGLKWIDSLHRAGKPFICEFDDDLFTHDFWLREVEVHKQPPEVADEIVDCHVWAVQHADGITVTNPELARLVSEHTDRPVMIVPNAIDLEWFREVQKRTHRVIPANQLTIGWFGGIRPDKDVEAMAVAWGRIAKRYKHVRFVVYGHRSGLIWEHVPAARIIVIPWVDIREYPAGLLNIDIGCAAVSDSRFNRCKTPIKAYEYAVSGAAVVATPTLYGDVIDDGAHGFIAETADQWESALARLIEDAGLRRRLNRHLLHRVEKRYSLESNLHRWPAAWAEILADYKARQIRHWFVPDLSRRAPLLVGAGGT